MNAIPKYVAHALGAMLLLSLVSCADMSRQESTAVGAATGAVAGAVITEGSPAGVVGGAIVGGVIGHHVAAHNNRYPSDRYYYNEHDGRYYHRYYKRGHRKVRCHDGVVLKARRNACRYHGGAKYYW